MRTERIGIFGGTFSPPHLGHRRALEAFIKQEQLDRVLVIPTGIPPHKIPDGEATSQDRFAMCQLAFGDLPVTVCDCEMKREGKSYTVLTLQDLKTEENTLLLLCGTDMFLTLDQWFQAKKIMELAEIIYVRRESDRPNIFKKIKKQEQNLRQNYQACVREITYNAIEISSSEIRAALREGNDTSLYLSLPVRRYIDKWQLYQK